MSTFLILKLPLAVIESTVENVGACPRKDGPMAQSCLSKSRTQPEQIQPHDASLSPAYLPPFRPLRESQTSTQVATAGQSSIVRVSKERRLAGSVERLLFCVSASYPGCRFEPSRITRLSLSHVPSALRSSTGAATASWFYCCLGGHKCDSTTGAALDQPSRRL